MNPVVINQPQGLSSTVNSSTTPLAGGATFTGTGEQNFFPDVMISVYADVAGIAYMDFSIDGTNWRTHPASGITIPAGSHKFHTELKGPRYFRVRYVNGSSAQSTFQLKTYYGTFGATASNAITVGDGPNLDAFSRVRVSDPVTLFTLQCQYDAEPLLMEGVVSGTGVAPAHNANTRMVALSCTAGTGVCAFQSYEYIPYQAGKSQLIFITGLIDAGVAGAIVDVGAFDAANGIFLRQNGASGLQLVRRTSTSGSVVNNTVNQADWNLDKLDGTGESKVTLDITKVQIIVIDAQFLAMGRVRAGFDIGGQIIYCHEFLNSNVITVPYMQTLHLPVQMLITATSTGSTKTCYFKCASVSSEGGLEEDLAYEFSTPEATVTAGSGAATHLLSIRPATTFNSITNRATIKLRSFEIMVTGAQPISWTLSVGATWSAAPTWAAVNATYSAVEYTSTVGTLSGVGTVIASGYVASSASSRGSISRSLSTRYPITLSSAGAVRANGTLTLNVSGIGGASATRAFFNYAEVR